MLSLGRQDELDLEAMSFADPDVEAGRRLFLGEDGANRACSFCHANAGANTDTDEGFNENFDTGAHGFDPSLPPDNGFGSGRDVQHRVAGRGSRHAAVLPQQQRRDHRGRGRVLHDRHLREIACRQLWGRVQLRLRFRSSRSRRSCAPSMRSTTPTTRCGRQRCSAMRGRRGRCEILRAVESDIEAGSMCREQSDLARDASRNSRLRWPLAGGSDPARTVATARDRALRQDVARDSAADRVEQRNAAVARARELQGERRREPAGARRARRIAP